MATGPVRLTNGSVTRAVLSMFAVGPTPTEYAVAVLDPLTSAIRRMSLTAVPMVGVTYVATGKYAMPPRLRSEVASETSKINVSELSALTRSTRTRVLVGNRVPSTVNSACCLAASVPVAVAVRSALAVSGSNVQSMVYYPGCCG